MKSKRRKRKIVPYRRRFHLNIGIIIFAFVFIYFVIYLISYLTQNNIAVYEVQYGQIAKNKSYTGLVLRPEQVFYANDAGSVNYYKKEGDKAGYNDLICSVDKAGNISEEISHFTSEFSVSAVKRTKIAEIFRERTGDKWYLVKVAFITLDEKTAVEKKSISQILVAADSFKEAFDNFMEGMKGTMADFEINTIQETLIMDVYDANLSGESKEA